MERSCRGDRDEESRRDSENRRDSSLTLGMTAGMTGVDGRARRNGRIDEYDKR